MRSSAGRHRLAGEHARVAAALPSEDRSVVVAEPAVLDAAACGRSRVRRRVECVARDDRVPDPAAALLVVDRGRAATGGIVLAGADGLPAELSRVVREGHVVDLRAQERRGTRHAAGRGLGRRLLRKRRGVGDARAAGECARQHQDHGEGHGRGGRDRPAEADPAALAPSRSARAAACARPARAGAPGRRCRPCRAARPGRRLGARRCSRAPATRPRAPLPRRDARPAACRRRGARDRRAARRSARWWVQVPCPLPSMTPRGPLLCRLRVILPEPPRP